VYPRVHPEPVALARALWAAVRGWGRAAARRAAGRRLIPGGDRPDMRQTALGLVAVLAAVGAMTVLTALPLPLSRGGVCLVAATGIAVAARWFLRRTGEDRLRRLH
jgi:hypothetical protein